MQRVLEPQVMDSPEEAAGYDAMDHSQPNGVFVERLIELGAHGRMLDIGTGPGHIPLLVCEKIPGARVFGIDLSREMLAIARRRLADSPFADRIEYHLADATDLPMEDGAFDTVFSNTILHHIPDPRPFLAEAWRVARAGAVVLIRDLYRPPDRRTLDELVQGYANDCTEHQRQMFRDSLKAALTPDELRGLVHELGLPGAQVVIDTDRHMSVQRSVVKA